MTGNTIHCDQCEVAVINGVLCHETGCPNSRKKWSVNEERWVLFLRCRRCGCMVEQGEACDCYNEDFDDDLDEE